MYCPQCGTEAAADQRFCRSCGANLKIIARAVSLGEAVARSDRGPLPKIKAIMTELKAQHASEEVTRAVERMNEEIVSGIEQEREKKEEKLELRRENHIAKGLASIGAGVGIIIFLYYYAAVIVGLIPPETLAKIPFPLEPALRAAWIVGLIPTFAGTGRLIGGLVTRPARVRRLKAREEEKELKAAGEAREEIAAAPEQQPLPRSVTEGTTELLDERQKASVSQGQ
ncbi:MAG TPA: zinc ribbon domain-containing protein [Pyrinomonadaceae bacterium]|nr:zinc ribbon domain-containing protein [Pyrinomonadaceae bacterium]